MWNVWYFLSIDRVVPIGRRDAFPLCVQPSARRNGPEGTGDDRLALIGSEQLRIRGAAALERNANGEAAGTSATLAFATASLRCLRVSASHGFILDATIRARNDLIRITRRRVSGRAFLEKNNCSRQAYLERGISILSPYLAETHCVLPGWRTEVNIPIGLSIPSQSPNNTSVRMTS